MNKKKSCINNNKISLNLYFPYAIILAKNIIGLHTKYVSIKSGKQHLLQ